MTNLEKLSTEIHRDNVAAGWWDNYAVKSDRHDTAMMLVVSELSEAMEGHRKNLMDDHLPHHKMLHVELADAAIRLLDLAGAYKMKLDGTEGARPVYQLPTHKSVPEQLFHCVSMTTHINIKSAVSDSLVAVFQMAYHHEVDIFSIIEEKRAYNRERLDHKKEVRAGDNGKRY